jgi:AraC-like DNA-binding protein
MKLIAERPSLVSATDFVACSLVRGSDFGDVWHYHAACEITLVKRGGTDRWVGDRLEPLTPGDLVFLGPDLPHDYRNAAFPGRRSERVEAIVIHFLPTLLGEGWSACASMEPLRRLFERARRGLQITGRTRVLAETLIERVLSSHGLRRLIVLFELLELLAQSKHLAEISSDGFLLEPKAYASDRIGTACATIGRHLTDPVRVPDLARQLGLSESAFSRLFKKCTNSTIPQYVNRLRIAHACRLLAETDMTVAEIIRTCGYLSPAHFQREFRKIHRRSPKDYRQRLRGPF